MDILVLGGTRFVGRHLVEAALVRGHRVTLFNRGKRGADLFPHVEKLVGERTGGLEPLRGRRWDAVVDSSGYAAYDVRESAELLAGAVGRYLFVSTISVYDGRERGMDESAPRHAPNWTSTEVTGDTYGGMKSACEDAVNDAFGERATIVRPGVVIGPHDYMNRFPYWCHRIAEGGQVLAPGDGEQSVQAIDARDLGAFMVRLLEDDRAGTFNAVGPARPTAFREFLEGIRDGVGGDARFTWVPSDFLREHDVGEWMELPFWLADPDEQAMQTLDASRAFAAGLTPRPIADSARDTLLSDRQHPPADERKGGMSRDREAAILAALEGNTRAGVGPERSASERSAKAGETGA